jgi:CRISPR/Cas system-associated exonuclease Cas4 (RecB family)
MAKLRDSIIKGSDALEANKFNFDRNAYLNSSEALSCIRKQWYAKNDAPAADQDWGFARRGIHGEKFVIDALRAANVPLDNAWPEQISIQDEKRRISASPDGLIRYPKEAVGLEIKTIDPRANKNNLPKPAHVAQIQIAMELISDHGGIPEGVIFERGVLLYMDASNYFDIIEFDIQRDYGILDRMAKRAKKVLNSKTPDALDREGKTNGDCRYCPFTETCGVSLADTKRSRANRGSAFDKSAQDYMEIKDEQDRLKTDLAIHREDIIAGLGDRGQMDLMVGNISVVLKTMVGRKSLDRKAVKKAGIDLAPYETVGAAFEQLTLKRT